jgi:methyl-accepting chemotaxis protein
MTKTTELSPGIVARLSKWLPRGNSLPEEVWQRRHRVLVRIVWLHVFGLAIFGIVRGFDPIHAVVEVVPVAVAAVVATLGNRRQLKAGACAFGLISSSAILVHFSGGVIEAHFHFFVMVATVSLYQDWVPFLLAILYTAVHHGLAGLFDPGAVFNHAAAQNNPVKWALIHAAFVLGACAAQIVTWRLNEEQSTQLTGSADQLGAALEQGERVKRSLEEAVSEYSMFADAVARGDLTARVQTNGSAELTALTNNLNGMVEGLAGLSGRVSKSAQGVGESALQILETVTQQSATVSQQSAAIHQTSVTVEELRASAEEAARRARDVAAHAQTSVNVSDGGSRAVQDIVARMEAIRTQVEAMAQNILLLSEKTQQISELTATVDDIAEQSNLLALNATIEAARAGEHGKGFAVVAVEVRNLAEQSKQGTAQVRKILNEIQSATNAAVMATERGINVVEEGRSLAGGAGEAIEDLAKTIRENAEAAAQIAASSSQQSVTVDQISESMRDVNEAAAEFLYGVEASKGAARTLNDVAQELRELTEEYKV